MRLIRQAPSLRIVGEEPPLRSTPALALVVALTLLACKHPGPDAGERARPTRVPFQLLDGRPYVEAMINGTGPFRMIVDTGGQNLITEDVAERLGLTRAASRQVQGAGEASQKMFHTTLGSLRLGEVEWRETPALIIPGAALRTPTGVAVLHGMIRAAALASKVVTFDYAAQALLFHDGPAPPEQGRVVVPFTLVDTSPTVTGTLDGMPVTLLVDTGDRFSVTLFTPFVTRNGLLEGMQATSARVTGWGVGGPVRAALARAGRLELAGAVIPQPLIRLSSQQSGVFARTSVSGSIGFGVLARFRPTFDYPRGQLLLDRIRASPYLEDRGGLWLNREGSDVVIADVWPAGPAQDAGLTVGDRVLEADGEPVDSLDVAQLRHRFRSPEGTRIRLKVATGPASREVQVVLRSPR